MPNCLASAFTLTPLARAVRIASTSLSVRRVRGRLLGSAAAPISGSSDSPTGAGSSQMPRFHAETSRSTRGRLFPQRSIAPTNQGCHKECGPIEAVNGWPEVHRGLWPDLSHYFCPSAAGSRLRAACFEGPSPLEDAKWPLPGCFRAGAIAVGATSSGRFSCRGTWLSASP